MIAVVATATAATAASAATSATALTRKYEGDSPGKMTDVILDTASKVVRTVNDVKMVVYNNAPSSEELMETATKAMDTVAEAMDTATKAMDTVAEVVNSVLGNDTPKQRPEHCSDVLLANAICPGSVPLKKNNVRTSQMNP